MTYYSNSDKSSGTVSCGCVIAIFVMNLLAGWWSVNYLLQFFLGKTLPFLGAAVIGLFTGELTIPVAVVIAILKWGHIL